MNLLSVMDEIQINDQDSKFIKLASRYHLQSNGVMRQRQAKKIALLIVLDKNPCQRPRIVEGGVFAHCLLFISIL